MNNYQKYDKEYHVKHREARNARARAWNAAHPEIVKARAKGYLQKFKRMVLDHYGQRCVCCGVEEEAFLTIDHINNNGKEHRAEVGNGHAFYRWIVKAGFPSDLRILCMNCNYGKRFRPQCPHLDKTNVGV